MMGNVLMSHGICKNHSISSGNDGTAAVTVDITVCLLGKRRDEKLVTSLSSTMGNGHSAVFTEFRDVELTEKFDCSSSVALLGFSFIIAIMRAFNVRDEAARVMVAAPLIAFVTAHILYLNFYKLDYGLNMKVSLTMGVAKLLILAIWAGVTRHPAHWKLWVVVIGEGLAMLLQMNDFPPYWGFVDAHSLYLAANIPLTYLSWSFIRDDAEFWTTTLLKE